MPQPIKPEDGQESVWDYPRPPRIETSKRHIQIQIDGVTIADSRDCCRVLETSHPPTYYIPIAHIDHVTLLETASRSWCEWKGQAHYLSLKLEERTLENVGWFYPNPTPAFADLVRKVAFYPSRVGECFVDGERVQAQPGDFYGGWITSDIVGPFKGPPGTNGW